MPTTECFAALPAFPQNIATAKIPTIPLDLLQANDKGVSKQLFAACIDYGFFALQLSGPDGERLLEDAEKMFEISSSTFKLDEEILGRFAYQPPRSLLG
jgi:isopenicillin N synthase-like dioxygenase